jgi:hypothetical protein
VQEDASSSAIDDLVGPSLFFSVENEMELEWSNAIWLNSSIRGSLYVPVKWGQNPLPRTTLSRGLLRLSVFIEPHVASWSCCPHKSQGLFRAVPSPH